MNISVRLIKNFYSVFKTFPQSCQTSFLVNILIQVVQKFPLQMQEDEYIWIDATTLKGQNILILYQTKRFREMMGTKDTHRGD